MIQSLLPWALRLLFIWNLIVFLIYAGDKRKAKKGRWRTSEKTLLVCSLLWGGAGAALAMTLLRHKTRHLRFRILVPAALVFTAATTVLLVRMM